MRAWLGPAVEALGRGDAAMLVHVVELKGSGPRGPGAQMLVTEGAIAGTIGGGELEHTATIKARELLHSGRSDLVRFALGPELNQCCGGSVMVAFEPFAPADHAWLKKLFRAAKEPAPVFRTVHIDSGGGLRRDWEAGGEGEAFAATFTSPLRGGRSAPSRARAGFGRGAGSPQEQAPVGSVDIRERVNPPAQALWLFGAGHVGRALVPALHPLGFAITWIDGRAGQLPESPLAGVRQLALAMPELIVDEAPPGTIFLVMTHSHPLDEAVCEAVLRRGDFAYLGLIGSATKRARFVKRLGDAGIPPKMLKRLICPIGLAGIGSKEPAAIAASVAADLLLRRERQFIASEGAVHHGR